MDYAHRPPPSTGAADPTAPPTTAQLFPNKTFTFGRLVLTTCRQDVGPVVDGCVSRVVEGWKAGGWCIRPPRSPGRALVIAWKGWDGPSWPLIRRLNALPIVRMLFRYPRVRRPR